MGHQDAWVVAARGLPLGSCQPAGHEGVDHLCRNYSVLRCPTGPTTPCTPLLRATPVPHILPPQ